jgi:hypothetical protein
MSTNVGQRQRARSNSLSGEEIWRWNKCGGGGQNNNKQTIRYVLIVTKPDDRLTPKAKLVVEYLLQQSSSLQLLIQDTLYQTEGESH